MRCGRVLRGWDTHGRSGHAASAWTVATGLLVLAGWTLDVPTLTRVLPGLPAMAPLAAAAFILAGIGLWLLGPAEAAPLRRRTGRVLALAVAVLGSLAEWVIGCDFGIDRMLFRGVLEQQLANGVARPGRPPPHTAAAFTAAGLALALLDADRRPGQCTHVVAWLATFPAVLSTALALTALLGYVYGVAYLRGVSTSTGMAVHTAMGVLTLNAGILVARPDRPVVRAFLARGPGGFLARRLAPTLLLLPFAIGLLGLAGAQADSDDPALGITVTTAGTILVLVVVVAPHRARGRRRGRGATAVVRRTARAAGLRCDAAPLDARRRRGRGPGHPGRGSEPGVVRHDRADARAAARPYHVAAYMDRLPALQERLPASDIESDLCRADGTRFTVLASAAPVGNPTGAPRVYVTTLKDITRPQAGRAGPRRARGATRTRQPGARRGRPVQGRPHGHADPRDQPAADRHLAASGRRATTPEVAATSASSARPRTGSRSSSPICC